MSLTNFHSLSKGDNDTLNTLNENISSTENNMRSGISVDNSRTNSRSTQMKSWGCSDQVLNTKFDIDIGHAIKLLKKEDQSINVYNHLQGILDKILSEKPSNPLENFEKYSQQLKRTYIRKEVNFERVFVDNINRNNCQNSLQMYKNAFKKQSEQQERYNISKKSSKNAGNVKDENNKIVGNGYDVNVQVQNLFEVNTMFNKAGCGLPLDEVALISMSMNEMARSNKFKKIRFWGKIFGMKRTYFIIECEWTGAESNRKLLKGDLITKSSTGDAGAVVHSNTTQKNDLSEFKAEKRSGSTVKAARNSADSDVADSDGETTGDAPKSNESWTSSSEYCSYKTISEVTPPEKIGIGANRCVYFVTNELSNSKWIELDSVQPHQIVGARSIKRYFTGKLKQPINSFPKFKGMELDYLRAQIARISSSTQICPREYYVFNSSASTLDKMSENTTQPLASLDLTEKRYTMIQIFIMLLLFIAIFSTFAIVEHDQFNFGLIPNKNFKSIPNKNMIDLNYWVHTSPCIEETGITNANNPGAPTPSKSIQHFESLYDKSMYEYGEENEEISLNANGELFGNLSNDIAVGNKPAWKGVMCSPFNSRYSCTAMMSHIWPGACAVVDQLKTDFVYIGWAQKQDCSDTAQYSSKLITGLKMEICNEESQTEFEEVQKNQKTDLESQLNIPPNEYILDEVENEFMNEYGIE